MPSSAIAPTFGGTAAVYCVHNRQKRSLTEFAFNPALTSIHLCSCCENVFTEPSDTPMFCPQCRGKTVYELRAPLPSPNGRV